MLTKQNVKNTIANLPENFTIDELIEKLIVVKKIEEGLEQSKNGETISNENIKTIISEW